MTHSCTLAHILAHARALLHHVSCCQIYSTASQFCCGGPASHASSIKPALPALQWHLRAPTPLQPVLAGTCDDHGSGGMQQSCMLCSPVNADMKHGR